MEQLKSIVRRDLKPAFWSWNIKSDSLTFGASFADFFDCPGEELPSTFEELSSFLEESDRSKFVKVLESKYECEEAHQFNFETSHNADHEEKPFNLKWEGEVIEAEQGKPILIAGQVQKVSLFGNNLSQRQQASLFKKLMDHLPDSIFFKDKESRFIAINNACASKLGLKNPEEAIGKTDFDFFDDEHARQAREDEVEVMESEQPIVNKTEKEVSRDGEKSAWASTTKLPLYGKDGTVAGTFGITRDVTGQQQTELELHQAEATLSRLSEQVPGFFYVFHYKSDGNACFPYASKGINDIYELEPEDVKESIDPIIDRIHEDDLNRVVQSIQHTSTNLEPWNIDFRVVLPEKGLRWVRGKAKPEKQPDGTVIGYGYITDITEEKEQFKKTAQLQEQLQQVIDSAPNLIFVKDIDGHYLMANESAADFFNLTAEEMVGKTDVDIGLSVKKAQRYLSVEKEVIEKNEPMFIPEDKTILEDGSEVWHQTIKVPFLNTDSGKPAVLSIVTDITRRKENELNLKNSMDIIGEQNKRLQNFAHIVSHNLRNHAGNISMLLSLYDMEESQEEKEELLSHLSSASDRLNESIADLNEIIDQQYKTGDELKELNLQETISKIKEILTTDILANNVKFEEQVPAGLSLEYNPAYLESILLNLLSNAIKYRHPDRKPKISIKAWEESDKVFLEISDNGLGIDMKKFGHRLFGMYNTFHGNDNAKGIGLYITKNQIESMGGSIAVDSNPGEGTTFKIQLQ
ncbi:PAS domain-containing protein [Gracilimonas sediminicola]|uniref:PAS domain-containing sensor histidine kinase n=1 Tax=Gracilimonas sediminicola TaxID=2952158 RepID=UPI0038D516BC